MKRILTVLAICALVFAGCGGGTSEDPGKENGATTLKIQNESFSDITEVIWNNISFGTIGRGQYVTKNTQSGQGYVRFKRTTSPINAQVNEVIVVGSGEKREFVITNNTLITNEQNTSETGTLGTLRVLPQITIKQGDVTIERYGVYDFGTVLLDTTRSRTFNIGNSGRANLLFNAVDGKSVTLTEDNASGFFSITQQPFATMAIPPEGTTDFVISFSPTITGQNFNVVVKVSTNSENDADFYFRVRGNASNEYSVGDTGPGGGTIFFAEGGQYKECSGELGIYNFSNALGTASSYRGGGFSNWSLPGLGELSLMYQNLHRSSLGGFLNAYYWSSYTYSSSSNYATSINFSTGAEYSGDYKTATNRVRAVRSFSL